VTLGFYLHAISLILYTLYALFCAVRQKRHGSFLIMTGFAFLGFAGINDMLLDMQVIRSIYVTDVGIIGFTLMQACALSLRLSLAFSSVERLSTQLADNNQALLDEMEERARLEREIVLLSERERRSISQELHDGLCQKLTGARLHFSVLKRRLKGETEVAAQIGTVSSLLDESVDQAYDLSRGLWPVEADQYGVSPSLEEFTRRMSENCDIAISFNQERNCTHCTNTSMIQVYRIAQEAITNAVKHAKATRIIVTLDCTPDGGIELSVCDDGIGRKMASRSSGGLGMGIMAHRATLAGGKLTVSDCENGGTLVTCVVPCEQGKGR
jgi:signal transduction histidine kinase